MVQHPHEDLSTGSQASQSFFSAAQHWPWTSDGYDGSETSTCVCVCVCGGGGDSVCECVYICVCTTHSSCLIFEPMSEKSPDL